MKNSKLEHLGLLLTPSPSSLIASIVLALFIVGAAFLANGAATNNDLSGGLGIINNFSADSLQNFKETLAKNEIISQLPLLLFWAAVGAVVYTSAIHIFTIFSDAEKLREEMDFVHADRNAMLRDALQKIALRSAAVITWLIYLKVTISAIFPYIASSLQVAVGSGFTGKVLYSLLATAVLLGTLHVHVILLRLITLRYRLLSSN